MRWRRAEAGDVAELARLNAALLEDEGHRRRLSIDELEVRMQGWLSGAYAAVLFESAGQTVAYTLYRAEEDGAIFVRHFFVSRAHRRRGHGRRAFDLLRREVLPTGARIVLDVLVDNATALAFWRALGFVDYATTLELR